ncbi:MAG: U32 family peptidase [Chitinispirillaceae bacterium]|nr:U32 family peptidase [Chitinispirillaceae bacterium]
MNLNKPELLAPVGSFQTVEAAIESGADAIYAGIGEYNLRAHAPTFRVEELPDLIEIVHSVKKKFYCTLNIIPNTKELVEIEKLLRSIKKNRFYPDAFIISDPGVMLLCKEILPEVSLHLSTQAGCFNEKSMLFWKQHGISRIILPREFTLEQIEYLAKKEITETEIFIHGAMCVSISGRCLLGAYLYQRHPNLGDCPQPCRWKYRLSVLPSNPLIKDFLQTDLIDIEEDNDGSYFMNSKDLCTISILPELIKSGVNAFKIEGRNKSLHYVATVVKVYREAIDLYIEEPDRWEVKEEWISLLNSIEHREYTTGFYKKEFVLQNVFTSKSSPGKKIAGIVKEIITDGKAIVDVKERFSFTDILEVIPVNHKKNIFSLSIISITDLSGNSLSSAPPNRLMLLETKERLQRGDILRKRS